MLPLARDNANILLLSSPSWPYGDDLYERLRLSRQVHGVLDISDEHFWTYANNEFVGSMKVRCAHDAKENDVLVAIRSIFSDRLAHLTIQVNKDSY